MIDKDWLDLQGMKLYQNQSENDCQGLSRELLNYSILLQTWKSIKQETLLQT